jgi:acyl dehydratase
MSIFEERFPVGKKFVSGGRTITEGDFSLLHNLTWTVSKIHADREYMKKHSQFGDMTLSVPALLSCVAGLSMTYGLRDIMYSPGTRTVANLGFSDAKFNNPVLPGDTITVHTEILGVRPTKSNPKRAVMSLRWTVFNQRDEQVMEAIPNIMLEATE